jgi:hypothetical protein
MENQNLNAANAQGGDLSDLKKMFKDFQKKSETQGSRRKSREEILTKYFVPRQPKETFRILPPKPGKKHIEEAFFHVVQTTIAGGKKKHNTIVYCPAHNNPKVKKLDVNGNPMLDANGQPIMIPAPCPLCAKAKEILKRQDPSLKGVKKETLNDAQMKIFEKNKAIFTEANKWEAKKFYIIRGIDKGKTIDGVKFWRFKHNYRKDGPLDKLLPVLEQYMTVQRADFSDAVNGTDLSIITTDSEFNGHLYRKVSAIMVDGKSPLHTDQAVLRQWLDDQIIWRDVFKEKSAPGITPYEFLEMVASGNNPYWEDSDATNKHWVFPGRPDLEVAANTRTRNLDGDDDENFEYASDVDEDEEGPRVTISNITPGNVGTYVDHSVDVGAAILSTPKAEAPVAAEPTGAPETASDPGQDDGSAPDYEDLPF